MKNKIIHAAIVFSLAIPVNVPAQNTHPLIKAIEQEFSCLVNNVYFEARNQPIRGQIAVAYVTMNRMLHPKFQDTICDVVHAKRDTNRGPVCQFSWVCEAGRVIAESRAYNRAKEVAYRVMTEYHVKDDPTNGALYFHATHVRPNWAQRFQRVVTIGDHVFYKPKDYINGYN